MTSREGTKRSIAAQTAQGGVGLRWGAKTVPKISRITEGRAIAASHVIGSRNNSLASVAIKAFVARS